TPRTCVGYTICGRNWPMKAGRSIVRRSRNDSPTCWKMPNFAELSRWGDGECCAGPVGPYATLCERGGGLLGSRPSEVQQARSNKSAREPKATKNVKSATRID